MVNFDIHINSIGTEQQIETLLLDSLRAQQPQATNTQFSLRAENSNQVLLGGLTASTSYGWLLVKTLWVDPDHRGGGLGRALLNTAEDHSRQFDCHGAWLDTSSSEARDFYRRCGYQEFGVLANRPQQYPGRHRRWFMQKQWSGD